MGLLSSLWPEQGGAPPLHTWLLRLCTLAAALGGMVVLSVATIVTASVLMRNLGLRGISGDFELVQMSCVFAAGLFLPLCQLSKGHVMVDIFTAWLPRSMVAYLDRFWTLVFAAAWGLLCFYTFEGMQEIRDYNDLTMLLRIPVWWSFVPVIIGTGLSAFIAALQAIFWYDEAVLPAEN